MLRQRLKFVKHPLNKLLDFEIEGIQIKSIGKKTLVRIRGESGITKLELSVVKRFKKPGETKENEPYFETAGNSKYANSKFWAAIVGCNCIGNGNCCCYTDKPVSFHQKQT